MKTKIICVLLLVVSAFMLAGCVTGRRYTEEEHVAYMSERMRVKLIDSDNAKVTDFEVYPLYDENDEFRYCLYECEPSGFAFSKVREKPFDYFYSNLYVTLPKWRKFIVRESDDTEITYNGTLWKEDEDKSFPNAYYECDENGNFVENTVSPFALAGFPEGKLYFLKAYHGYIPAVKSENGNYINLISLEEFEYKAEYAEPEYEFAVPKLSLGFFIKDKLKTPNRLGIFF